MHKARAFFSACARMCALTLVCQCSPTVVRAAAVEWPMALGGNGHWYDAVLVESGVNWSDAQVVATGRDGYLATITSAAEDEFVYELVREDLRFWYIDQAGNAIGPWLGGLQPALSDEPAGNWQWVTGEPMAFTNWGAGEPNNAYGTENRIVLFGVGTPVGPYWNDLTDTWLVKGYIVEMDNPEGPTAVAAPSWGQLKAKYATPAAGK